MKPTAVLALSWGLLMPGAVARAQEFQNLDFEQAMPELPGYPGDDRYRYAANVLPHWLVNEGFPEWWGDAVAYNTYGHIGTEPLIHVFGGDGVSTDAPPSPHQYRAVAGNYSAALDPRWGGASLQQTGQIPAGARSLRFFGYIVEWPFSDWAYGDVDISLNSVSLPIHDLGPVVGATYRQGLGGDSQVFQYGVNIPAGLAGTTAMLRFYAEGEMLSAFLVLDDIQFSPIAIPEPATFGLAAISAIALTTVRRRVKRPRP